MFPELMVVAAEGAVGSINKKGCARLRKKNAKWFYNFKLNGKNKKILKPPDKWWYIIKKKESFFRLRKVLNLETTNYYPEP